MPESSSAGNWAPRLPAGRWDRTAANRTAQSMSLHLAAGSAAASARSRRDRGPDKVRQYLRGRSTHGRAESDEQPLADAGQVVPTMSRRPLRAPLRNSAAAPYDRLARWLDGMETACLTAMRHLDDIEAWSARPENKMSELSGKTPPAFARRWRVSFQVSRSVTASMCVTIRRLPMALFLNTSGNAAHQRESIVLLVEIRVSGKP